MKLPDPGAASDEGRTGALFGLNHGTAPPVTLDTARRATGTPGLLSTLRHPR